MSASSRRSTQPVRDFGWKDGLFYIAVIVLDAAAISEFDSSNSPVDDVWNRVLTQSIAIVTISIFRSNLPPLFLSKLPSFGCVDFPQILFFIIYRLNHHCPARVKQIFQLSTQTQKHINFQQTSRPSRP